MRTGDLRRGVLMARPRISLMVAGTVVILVAAGSTVFGEAGSQPAARAAAGLPGDVKIARRPPPAAWRRPSPKELPKFDPAKIREDPWQLDLRHADVSGLNLRERTVDLLLASFDDGTRWPSAERLPTDFDRKRIMELGKDPGLGVRALHRRGITGKGVGIAIIDQTLLTEHVEYKDRLRLYEEMPSPGLGRFLGQAGAGIEFAAAMHGPAVASIAVGRTVGVAPEADLYYIAASFGTSEGRNFKYVAKAIRRMLEITAQLPAERRIRVISISVGWDPREAGYKDVAQAAADAKAAGLLVICSSVEQVHGFKFHGLGREPLADPEKAASYGPGIWWKDPFERDPRGTSGGRLLVPMDSRTTASPHGADQYVFYRQGGWSWSIPYIAGLYAMAVQVDPSITPERFWGSALKTSQATWVNAETKGLRLDGIVDAARLIDAVGGKQEK